MAKKAPFTYPYRVVILSLLTIYILVSFPYRLVPLTYFVFTEPATIVRQSDQHDRYWDAIDLENRLTKMGWTVSYGPIEDALGMTSFHVRTIQLDESMSWNARLAVLAHEGGHTLQPAWASHGHSEAFAETVAALVARDGLRNHGRYLARVRGDYLLMILTEWQAIYRAAHLLETF